MLAGSSVLAAPGWAPLQGAVPARLRLLHPLCPCWDHPIPLGTNEAAACADHAPQVHRYRSPSGVTPELLSWALCPATHSEAAAGPVRAGRSCSLLRVPCGWWTSSTPCLTVSLCTDNLWSDQSLETDPDLPPGWRKIRDSLGTYYWHVPSGTTQWQHPACTTSPGGHPEADGEDTLQGMVGGAGGGRGLVVDPTPWQNPAEGPSGHCWPSLPWEQDCHRHSKVLLSPLLARFKPPERLQQAPYWLRGMPTR